MAEDKKQYNTRKRRERKTRNRQRKLLAIETLGGQCIRCDLKADETNFVVFDFHHTDATTKETNIAELFANGRPFEVIMDEVAKCVVLCSNCHRLHHYEELEE